MIVLHDGNVQGRRAGLWVRILQRGLAALRKGMQPHLQVVFQQGVAQRLEGPEIGSGWRDSGQGSNTKQGECGSINDKLAVYMIWEQANKLRESALVR